MSTKHRNLIQRITDIENLREAYRKTAKAKRATWGYLEFKEFAEANLVVIQQELRDGSYRLGPYREFTVYEPKQRQIAALDFKDRLVQHALVNVIGPIFEATLLPQTFACRPGKGTHAGVRCVQSRLRSTHATHFLKTDFRQFFPSIDRAVLHQLVERKVRCDATLRLLREIVPATGRGLPIGSLTSQLFANVYAGVVDRFIHFDLRLRHWARYMDDIVILGHDSAALREVFGQVRHRAAEVLGLTISKWQVAPVSRGINFLGYRIWPRHKLLRKRSVIAAKRKVARYRATGDEAALTRFLASWRGHAAWADTHNLRNHMEVCSGDH